MNINQYGVCSHIYWFILTSDMDYIFKYQPNHKYQLLPYLSNKSSSPLGSPVSNVANDMEGDDVRLLMGEDGFTLGELSHPKALRFSIGDSKPQQILQDEGSCAKSSTLSSAHQIDAVKSTCHVGKYSNFIQVR